MHDVSPLKFRIVHIRTLGVVTCTLFVAMAIHAAPLQPSIPTIQFTFSATAFGTVLERWQPAGIERFRWHFAIDFPFLMAYGLYGYLLAMRIPGALKVRYFSKHALSCTAVVAALLDATENAMHLSFISTAARWPDWLYAVAGVVSTLKWLLIGLFGVGYVYSRLRTAG